MLKLILGPSLADWSREVEDEEEATENNANKIAEETTNSASKAPAVQETEALSGSQAEISDKIVEEKTQATEEKLVEEQNKSPAKVNSTPREMFNFELQNMLKVKINIRLLI